MISKAAHIQKLNRRQKVVKEESEKLIAQFPIGVVSYFG
jgi:hypothetical protein